MPFRAIKLTLLHVYLSRHALADDYRDVLIFSLVPAFDMTNYWIICMLKMMATHHEPYLFKKKHSQKLMNQSTHDDVIKWKRFPRHWPFVRGIHRSPVNSSHKGQWRGALMFSLIWARINGWVNKGEAGELRRYRPHYDVSVMQWRRIFNLGNLGNYIRASFFFCSCCCGLVWVWLGMTPRRQLLPQDWVSANKIHRYPIFKWAAVTW